MSEETKDSKIQAPPAPLAESDEIDQKALEQIDSLLAETDPSFSEEIAAIKSEKFEGEIEVENFELEDDANQESHSKTGKFTKKSKLATFVKRRKAYFIAGLKGLGPYLISVVTAFLKSGVESLKSLLKLPRQSKLILLFSLVLIIGTGFFVKRSLQGHLFPDFELRFLTSFKNLADHSFTIEEGEPFEDFDNPLRQPEYIVLIERLVVNLKASRSSENPMGMFEFYIESNSQEGAIEINNRQKEVRDLMARTIEESTYDSLSSVDGKDKMKQALRRELNTLLTHGRIRRVYFKTIILKP